MVDYDFEERMNKLRAMREVNGEDMLLHLMFTWVKTGVFSKRQFKTTISEMYEIK